MTSEYVKKMGQKTERTKLLQCWAAGSWKFRLVMVGRGEYKLDNWRVGKITRIAVKRQGWVSHIAKETWRE